MTEQPDTSWDRDYRKRTQECIDAKAQVAGRPSPLMLPASGLGVQALLAGFALLGELSHGANGSSG